ncbi:MAG: PQQ-dependent sugar dehydrogenase, partial [Lysobacterales bacterium]
MPLVRPWLTAALFSLAGSSFATAADSTPLKVEVMASGLQQPWSLAFIDANTALITEKPGRLRLYADNQLQPDPIVGVPTVFHAGQGGLLEVLVDRDFSRNQRIYLSYA